MFLKTRTTPTKTPPPAAGNMVLAFGAVGFAGLVLFASLHPSPGTWGIHLSGFLPAPLRFLVLSLLVASAALIAATAVRRTQSVAIASREASTADAGRRQTWMFLLGLVPLAALLWVLRARTYFLGDGTIWLARVTSPGYASDNEPLSAWVWHGYARLLNAAGVSGSATAISTLSILCGLCAAALMAGIACRLTARGREWRIPFALLLTLGMSQLYFGYIESYPVASVLVLVYLWLALRRLDGLDSPWLVALWLPIVIAGHFSALYLIPSFAYLSWREPASPVRRVLYCAVPVAGTGLLLVLLAYSPSQLAHPFLAAMSGFRRVAAAGIAQRPYGFFSPRHAADVANALLLAMPIPVLLMARSVISHRRTGAGLTPRDRFLGLAALPGFCIAAILMTPVAPAQDWDLASLLLLPAAVLGIALGRWGESQAPRRGIALGLTGLSLGALFSFVLVTADETAGIKRFAVVATDPAWVSPQGRAYANSLLEQYYRQRDLPAQALPFARAALDAERGNVRFWINAGLDLLALDRIDEALPFLEGAVKRDAERWEGRFGLGVCYRKQQRYAESAEQLRAAVHLEDNRPDVRHELAKTLHFAGQEDSASAVWNQVVGRWPEYAAKVRAAQPAPK